MSTEPQPASRSLPERPDLSHLKHQAKDLLRAGGASSLTDAQFKLAREYGFSSWPELKAYVESLRDVGQLKEAIDADDLPRIKSLMTENRQLHQAPMGYNDNGPLTWVAECRGVVPTPERLAIARWMIENGSDVHQGGDGPLMRAALQDNRIPMIELLLEHGADVNALWDNHYPIICAPCETLAAGALKLLLQHGADPNFGGNDAGCVPMLISTYWRDPNGKSDCLQVFADAGYEFPDTPVMAIHRGRADLLKQCLDREPADLHRQWPETDFFPMNIPPNSGLHGVSLDGATLLHMAIEFQLAEIAAWLIEQGADVNAPTAIDSDGFGGHTPLFHTISTPARKTDQLARLLLSHGADPNLRATFRRIRSASGEKYEQPFEHHDASALDFARQFEKPGYINDSAVIAIQEHGGE